MNERKRTIIRDIKLLYEAHNALDSFALEDLGYDSDEYGDREVVISEFLHDCLDSICSDIEILNRE